MYHGEKFEVSDIEWSSNLDGYNFKFKPVGSKKSAYGASYFPKSDSLAANRYMWSRMGYQLIDIFNPYAKKVSDNYLIFGGVGTQDPVNYKQYKVDYRNKALSDLFSKSPSVQEWIKEDHNFIQANVNVFIAVPRTAEGIYKTLQMIEAINNKLRSFKLYKYDLEVITYDVPKGFNIDNYFEEVKSSFTTNIDWWFVEGIQKYAWGYFNVKSCEKIDKFEKFCNTYKDDNGNLKKKLIAYYTTADRINNLQDVINNFYIVTKFGVPRKCNSLGCGTIWSVRSRATTPLAKSEYYQDLEKILNNNK